MSDDNLFRWILLTSAAVLLPVAAYHRIRSMTTEKLDRRQEGLFILIALRTVGGVGVIGLIAYLINPEWMAWSSVPLPVELRWTGVGIGVLAGLLLIWTFHNLGKNLTDTVVTRKEHTLVTTGPYRWVRHPFYLAFALAMLANSLATANWFIFAGGMLGFGLIVLRTAKEEANLVARFGDAYRSYMARTGRFFPRVY